MAENRRRAEVVRLLERYLVEVVEMYDLCPWAKLARQRKEVGVEVLWGSPSLADWVDTARDLLDRRAIQVVMIVAPETPDNLAEFRRVRDRVAAELPMTGVAEFHPDANLDLSTPPRLVPFLRRSPDPLLQLVPLSLLDAVRAAPHAAAREQQAQILVGRAPTPKPDTADRIAIANHAMVTNVQAQMLATLDDIMADRKRSYALAGISGSR